MTRMKKLSKRPNGVGTIIKLKGNRRKPFCVRITIGRDADKRPVRKNLEYFETLQEAQDFLDLYNLMKKKSNRITLPDDQAKQIDDELFNVVKETSKRNVFTLEEIQSLIACDTIKSKIILIYIFTGYRPIVLFTVDVNNIFIYVPCNDDGTNMIVSYMIVSSKTDAGTNRIVPIHNLIKPYIQELLNIHPTHLILDGTESKHLGTYYRYNYFNKLIDQLHMQHVPYDTRHTFASLAKLFKVDEFARKRIMGHKSIDLTDDIYTHSYINVLYKEVHKIDLKIS